MPVETAADLESFFAEEEFAEAAVYLSPVPGSVAVPCRVIVDRGQGRAMMKAAGAEFAGSDRHIWVRKAEVNAVVKDATFTLGSEIFAVLVVPKLDQTGRLWSVELLIRD